MMAPVVGSGVWAGVNGACGEPEVGVVRLAVVAWAVVASGRRGGCGHGAGGR